MQFSGSILWLQIFVLSLACSLSSRAQAEIDYVTVLTFGDSITQGYARDAEGNEYGILEPPRGARIWSWGYQIELEILIENDLGAGTSSVYNWGYHGLRSDQALSCNEDWDCIDDVLSSREADIILIMLGANDLNSGISPETTRFNLSMMIDKSISHGVEPIIGTITPNTADNSIFDPAMINQYYNPLIRELAREKDISLAEHYEAMVDEWDLLYCSGDGLHLSYDGNRRLAETWYDALLQSHLFNPPGMVPVLHLLLLGEKKS